MSISVTVHGFHVRTGEQSNGRFATANISTTDGTDHVLYTVPGGDISYAILSVSVCNRAEEAVNNVNIAVSTNAAPLDSEFIEYNTTIVPRGVLERTQIIAAVGDNIVLRVGTP
jgi:hypothetical protein|tara:strand:- start:1126 stop:1467 length:342 start_codon:yes stop_codon:yes gene_type:complete